MLFQMFKSKTIAEKSKIDGFLYVPTHMFELRLKNMTIKIFTLARTNRLCVFDQKKYLTSNKKIQIICFITFWNFTNF